MEQLDQRGWLLGGESSGHLVCLDRTSTGDGTVAALQVLDALRREGLSLREAALAAPLLPQTVRASTKVEAWLDCFLSEKSKSCVGQPSEGWRMEDGG